jgi:hypothetical protein
VGSRFEDLKIATQVELWRALFFRFEDLKIAHPLVVIASLRSNPETV